MKRIIISVTNDITYDQRVHRVAETLTEAGANVLLVGRKLPHSVPLNQKKYGWHRMNVPFKKGFLFYASYNIWLFFFLLFRKADGLLSNDLDTLPANYMISKIKNIPLVFDSHEYFSETPEVTNRVFVKKFWLSIEKMFVPKVKHLYTVCNSISNIYKSKYNIDFKVVRNLPFRHKSSSDNCITWEHGKKIIIYQGALNIGRGIELIMDSLKFLDDNIIFIIAGEGDISSELRNKAKKSDYSNRIKFLGRFAPQDLFQYTSSAHLGVSLEENIGLNYYYALPNKLFDYIQAEIPVLTSDFPEMSAIVNSYDIGLTIKNRVPENLAKIINEMLSNTSLRDKWKNNLKIAAENLCWEKEKEVLLSIFKEAGLIYEV